MAPGKAQCNEDQGPERLAWAGVVDQVQIREEHEKVGNSGEDWQRLYKMGRGPTSLGPTNGDDGC